MAEVTMTMEEYLALVNGLSGNVMPEQPTEVVVEETPRRRSRSARRADKLLSAAFKEANARYRLKNGQLRKGRTQSDIAKLAHKLRKKMS